MSDTVWYRNTDTDVPWEVEVGSPLERRLKTELNDDPDNPELRYELIDSPDGEEKPLSRQNLDELKATAAAEDVELGADDTTKAKIAEAIQKHRDAAAS